MSITATHRLIQFNKIAVLTDLETDSEKILRYAGSLARWYGAKMLLAHACTPELYVSAPPEPLPNWPESGMPPKEDAEEKVKSLTGKLHLQDLVQKVIIREESIGLLLRELEEYHPNLVVIATHGREGIRKWLSGSVCEEVFRKVQWPVLVLGPGLVEKDASPQKQFRSILYATDLSAVSVSALQYAAGIAHDHEAQLIALFVDENPEEAFSFDRAMALQRLNDWLADRADGLAEALIGVHSVVESGKAEKEIVKAAVQWGADLVVLGARGLRAVPGVASHFIGGTAYEVVCSSGCPVLIVPQPL